MTRTGQIADTDGRLIRDFKCPRCGTEKKGVVVSKIAD
jgi:transcription elongation factor Elf1